MEAWRQTLPRQRSGEITCRGRVCHDIILVKFPVAAGKGPKRCRDKNL
jgi:hypothetical protein